MGQIYGLQHKNDIRLWNIYSEFRSIAIEMTKKKYPN